MSEEEEEKVLEKYGRDLVVSFKGLHFGRICYGTNEVHFCGHFSIRNSSFEQEMTLEKFINNLDPCLEYVKEIE